MIAVTARWVGFLFLALWVGPIGFSKDLGTLGKLYPIEEMDLLETIEKKLSVMEKNGETEAIHKNLLQAGKSYVKRPKGIMLPRTKVYKATSIDPRLKLTSDIKDADGKVLFTKGTVINPLDHRRLTKKLCFFDADDSLQVSWAQKNCLGYDKLILVNGDFLKTTKALGRRVYFDQNANLVNRFQIEAVPSMVSQQGRRLYVEIFPLD